MYKKYEITDTIKDTIIQMYNRGSLDSEISQAVNLPSSSIYLFRKKNNMPSNYGRVPDKNKEKIMNLVKMELSMKNISKRTNIGLSSLREFFRRNRLLDLRKHRDKKKYKVGNREKSILCGILLGDGTIYKYNEDYFKFTVRHGPKQKLYSEYIYNQLRHLPTRIKSIKIKDSTINGKPVNSQIQSEVTIIKCSFLKDLYNNFYINHKKVIPLEFIVKYYNAEALSFHFMDDGSKCCDSTGKINGFILSTNSFTKEEIENFSLFLLGRFSLYSSVVNSNGKYVLRIKSKSVSRFINLIKPYIIDSLKYKISSFKTPLNRELDGKSCAKPFSNERERQTTNSDA